MLSSSTGVPTETSEADLLAVNYNSRNMSSSLRDYNLLYDMNNNKKPNNIRKHRNPPQRVLSYKVLKPTKTVPNKTSLNLLRKSQSDNGNVLRQQFMDDVGLGILKFYRAATKVTRNRYHKSATISHNNNLIKTEAEKTPINSHIIKNTTQKETLDAETFYTMQPDELVSCYLSDVVVSNLCRLFFKQEVLT